MKSKAFSKFDIINRMVFQNSHYKQNLKKIKKKCKT